jgi:RNA recognition motif-containing protein
MRDPAGRSRGFAFLTFEDPAAVNAVMVREHYLDGKIVSFPCRVRLSVVPRHPTCLLYARRTTG